MIETEQLTRIVEGALMAAGKPLSLQQLAELFDEQERPDSARLKETLEQIEQACQGRGFELRQVSSGYRFQVVQDVSPWVGRLWEEKPQRYSRALLETLALIAYRQPITRGDIEDIRGVAVSTQIIKTLLEREWVRVVGHKDVPGRPAMYATTRKFLDYFNLRNLDELPALANIRDLDSLNGELAFMEEGIAQQEAAESAELAEASPSPEQGQDAAPDHEAAGEQVSLDDIPAEMTGDNAPEAEPEPEAMADEPFEEESAVGEEEASSDRDDAFTEESPDTDNAQVEEDSTADSEYR